MKKKTGKAKPASKPIATLKSRLAFAFDSESADQSPKYERARYIHALKAISNFLKEVGIASYEKRFYRLALAMDDLNRGSVDPLLEPMKTGGAKNRNVSWDWCARAHVAGGISALLKAGLTRKSAAQWAASKYPEMKKLAGLSRVNPSSTTTKVLSWYDDFNKGDRSKIKNAQALVVFAAGKQEIERLPYDPDGLRKVADRMFASALQLILRD